jgi:hypothetical protein
MLAAIRSPGWRADAILLGLCVLAVLTRLQFVVLLPAAILAVAGAAAADPRRPGSPLRRALTGLREHWLLAAATVALVLLGVAALAGTAALSFTGRYANQRTLPIPSPWILIKLFAWHLAGLVFAVAVLPFAGALLATYLWLRGARRPDVTAFAAVAVSVTVFVVGISAAASYGQSYAYHSTTGDLARIHERYMFYVVPLFLVAMLATTRLARSQRLLRAGAAAALVTGLLPLIIPWRTVMNDTIAVDTFGFTPFAAAAHGGGIQAHTHAALLAVVYALCLAFAYALARPNVALVSAIVALAFVGVSFLAQTFLLVAARTATAHTLPARSDWVEAAGARGDVALVYTARSSFRRFFAEEETPFFNSSVTRVYYTCGQLFAPDFGQTRVHVDTNGQVSAGPTPVRAAYVVAPRSAGVQGRLLARDGPGGLVLLQPAGEVIRVPRAHRAAWTCPRATS